MQNSPLYSLAALIRGSVISILGCAVIGLINFFIRRTLVLNLTVSDYGYIYAVISFLALISAFSDLGLCKAITIRAASLCSGDNQKALAVLFSTSMVVKTGLAFLVCSVLAISIPFFQSKLFHYSGGYLIFYFLLVWFLFANAMGVITAFLEAFQMFLFRNIFFLINYGIIFLFIILYIDTLGPKAPPIAFALGTVISFVVAAAYIKIRLNITIYSNKFSSEDAKKLFHYAKWIAFSTAGLCAMPHVDTVMLTFLHGTQKTGEYNIALPIVQIIQSVLIFPTVFIPIASRLWNTHQIKHLSSVLYTATLALLILFAFGCITLHYCGQWIISILFSEKFSNLSPIVTILSAGVSLFLLGQLHLDTLNIAKRTTTSSKIVAVGLLVNIAANLALIPTYELYGAAIATSFSYLVIFVLSLISTRRLFNEKLKQSFLAQPHTPQPD